MAGSGHYVFAFLISIIIFNNDLLMKGNVHPIKMSNYPPAQNASDISAALVKEYLLSNGFKNTLKCFEQEASLVLGKISSRRELQYHLGMKKFVAMNQQKESPFASHLEIMVDSISTKLELSRGPKRAQNQPPSTVTKLKADVLIKNIQQSEFISAPPGPAANSLFQSMSQRQFERPKQELPFSKQNHNDDIEIIEDLDLSDTEHIDQSRVKSSAADFNAPHLNDFNLQDDQELSKLIFPSSGPKEFSPEWKGKGFQFQTIHEIAYGLIQIKGGPCGLLAAVQATIIKNLVWSKNSYNQSALRPNSDQTKSALLLALRDILWTASKESGKACLVLKKSSSSKYRLTGGFGWCEFQTETSLLDALTKNADQFMHTENRGDGIIQFLLSVILSRGVKQVRGDMDEWSEGVMGKHSYCTQEMVNLILIGKATSNLFDGVVDLDGQKLKGLSCTCEIGQLSLFEHYDNLKIGSNGKNPIYPIYVVCSESHYTTLFALDQASKSSNTFDFFYYDGLSNPTAEIKLSVKLIGREKETRSLIPPLELCLATKWGKDLYVDWNGTEPLL